MRKQIFRKHYNDLRRCGYQAVFFDECHMGCGKESNKVYKAVTEFADLATNPRLVLSTGTPIPNSIYDLFPLIKLKTPSAYSSRRHYDAEHVTFQQISIQVRGREKLVQIPDHDAYRNIDKLNRNLMRQAVRKTKQEVLELDAPNVQIVPVKLSTPHMKLYRKVLKDRIFEVNDEMIDARAQQKLRQVALQLAVNPRIASEEGTVKDNAVIDTTQAILDSVGAKDKTKVLLFATYNSTVEMLQRVFMSGYNPAIIYGPNGADKNRKNLTKFKEDGTCRLLIANPIAGGVGITAGDVAHTVIFVEPVSTPAAFDQAASRVILKGQKTPVSVYVLKILDTISPNLIDLMMGKARTMVEVTMDKKSVFDSLLGR